MQVHKPAREKKGDRWLLTCETLALHFFSLGSFLLATPLEAHPIFYTYCFSPGLTLQKLCSCLALILFENLLDLTPEYTEGRE